MKRIFFIIILATVIILAIMLMVKLTFKSSKMETFQKVEFITKDGVTIVADYYPNKDAKYAGIFIHMRPATRESYRQLATFFQKEGFTVLSIDLRGHGESVNSIMGKLNYLQFSFEEEKNSINDLEAASLFLEKEGFEKSRQFLIGASIGANLAYQFLSENPKIKAAVLLSPGLNYHGITLARVKNDEFGQKILLIATLSDENSSAVAAINSLREWYPTMKYFIFQSSKHGTDILNSHPELGEQILNWLRERLI
ncbi:MAG: alpha/beta fold hydrolase [Patescibacteria group bacterium]|nr:alpha/beta fold hydrolase [Patescibacteria group bacterium]